MRAYENIIDVIGAENIKLLLPMWETSGTEFSDLLRPNLKFIAEGVTLGQPGLLHPVPSFDGVNDYVRQKPITEATAGTDEFALTNATWKAAQKLPANALAGYIKFLMLKLKKVGSPDANIKVDIVEDNAGQPTGAVVASTEAIDASTLLTTAALIGLYFATAPSTYRYKTYWVVLYYSSDTTIDASNYVSWVYDSAGAYGQPRASYDGTTWTVTSGQSHAFAVYDDHLTLSGDYSIVVACSVANPSLGDRIIVNPSVAHSVGNELGGVTNRSGYIMSNMASVGGFGAGSPGNTASTTILYPFPVSSMNEIISTTFSYTDSTDKYKLYRGSNLVAKMNGTASAGPNPPRQPFFLGAGRRDTTLDMYWFFPGKIGPVIVTSNVLTQAQLGKIQNQLLALRRLREAV